MAFPTTHPSETTATNRTAAGTSKSTSHPHHEASKRIIIQRTHAHTHMHTQTVNTCMMLSRTAGMGLATGSLAKRKTNVEPVKRQNNNNNKKKKSVVSEREESVSWWVGVYIAGCWYYLGRC